jgi:putative transposase
MTNHVHLLLTPAANGSPARLMQSLGRRYVQYVNRFYRRTGSLWEGRYKSSLVQAETYLLACYRYIELNPVRAGMVADPGQYRWSSYRANGLGLPDARLTAHPLYLAQGSGADERAHAYRALFRPHLDAEAAVDIRQALQLGMPVGQGRFAELVCATAGIRFNSGKRGRPEGRLQNEVAPTAGQKDFGF